VSRVFSKLSQIWAKETVIERCRGKISYRRQSGAAWKDRPNPRPLLGAKRRKLAEDAAEKGGGR